MTETSRWSILKAGKMSDLVSREQMIRAVDSLSEDYISYHKLLFLISRLPSAEPEERTAKVMKHHYDFDPRKDSFYQGLGGTELLCGNCKKKVIGGDDYCLHCGVKLDWNE